MIYLLDNNVISELWKPKPDPAVEAFVVASEWFIPSVVIAEIQEGAEAAPSPTRKAEINFRLDEFLTVHGALVVSWDSDTARTWGRQRHSPVTKRRPQPLWDSLIDALAVRIGATVATRDAKGFRHAQTYNPFSENTPGQPTS